MPRAASDFSGSSIPMSAGSRRSSCATAAGLLIAALHDEAEVRVAPFDAIAFPLVGALAGLSSLLARRARGAPVCGDLFSKGSMDHFLYRDGRAPCRGRADPRDRRRGRHAVLRLFDRDAHPALPPLRGGAGGVAASDLLRGQGELQPRGAAGDGGARGGGRRGLGRRVPPRQGGGGAGRADRLLGRRQDPRRDAAGARRAASASSTSNPSPSSRRWTRWRRRPRRSARRSRSGSTRTWTRAPTPRSPPASPRTSSACRSPAPARSMPRRRGCRGIEVVGIDVHIGSQLTDLAPFEAAFAKVAELTEVLRADGHAIRRLDLGGGLGIPYTRSNEAPPLPFDYGAVIRRTVGHLGCEIEIEPGRLIAGNAGLLVAAVIYLKARRGAGLPDPRRGDERPGPPRHVRRLARYCAGGRGGSRASSSARSTWWGRSARPATPSPAPVRCRRWRPAIWWRSARRGPMVR